MQKKKQSRRMFPPALPGNNCLLLFVIIGATSLFLPKGFTAGEFFEDVLQDDVRNSHDDDHGDEGRDVVLYKDAEVAQVPADVGGHPHHTLGQAIASQGYAGHDTHNDKGPQYDIPNKFQHLFFLLIFTHTELTYILYHIWYKKSNLA